LSQIRKRLKFRSVAGWIEKKQRRLFADLVLEADMRLDHEGHASGLRTRGQRPPGAHIQNDAKMRRRRLVAVDGVMMNHRASAARFAMGDDLLPEEVKIDLRLRTAALGTAGHAAVEVSCGFQIINGKSDVKWCKNRHLNFMAGLWRRRSTAIVDVVLQSTECAFWRGIQRPFLKRRQKAKTRPNLKPTVPSVFTPVKPIRLRRRLAARSPLFCRRAMTSAGKMNAAAMFRISIDSRL